MSGVRRYPIDGTPYHIQVRTHPHTRASVESSLALIEAFALGSNCSSIPSAPLRNA